MPQVQSKPKGKAKSAKSAKITSNEPIVNDTITLTETITVDEPIISEPIVNDAIIANDPVEEVQLIINESNVNESIVINEELKEEIKEDVKEESGPKFPTADRKLKVYWQTHCNPKESTLTTLYVNETLKLTDGKVSIQSEEDPEVYLTYPVYSLKRGKRIYYVLNVTDEDINKAEAEALLTAKLKSAERAAKEALKSKTL